MTDQSQQARDAAQGALREQLGDDAADALIKAGVSLIGSDAEKPVLSGLQEDLILMGFHQPELCATAPPKSAPDAMRKTLASRIENCKGLQLYEGADTNCGYTTDTLSEDQRAEIVAALRASAPVPPADGALDAHHLYFALMGLTGYVCANFPHSMKWNQGGVKVVELATESIEKFQRYDYDAPTCTGAAESNNLMWFAGNISEHGSHVAYSARDAEQVRAVVRGLVERLAVPPIRGDREATIEECINVRVKLRGGFAGKSPEYLAAFQDGCNAFIDALRALLAKDVANKEADHLASVIAALKRTEHQDIEFVMLQYGGSHEERRALIRSFRTQIINAAAGEMYSRLSRQAPRSSSEGEREPTPNMRIAGGIAWTEASKTAETLVDCADACWKAMWDAR